MTPQSPGERRAAVWLALYDVQPAGLDVAALVVATKLPERDVRSALDELAADKGAAYVVDGVWRSRKSERDREPIIDPPELPVPTDRPIVLLVDGKNLLYRALMSKGDPVEVDFPKRLADLRARYAPHFAVLAWDADGPTWRHTAYADYKGQRGEPSPYERTVYAHVPDWAVRAGYQFIEAAGWEADDIIGTLAAKHRDAFDVVIVSNDKDFAQILGPGVTMLKGWNEVITHEDVPKEPPAGWGVPVARIPDLLAIMGDSSDNIPGVPKVGEKGAAKLIMQFGGVEDIIAAAKAGKDKAAARAERIVAHADALRLFLRLTTISCGISGLPALVPCSTMTPTTGKRAEPEGMFILDGVLYPLPETMHAMKKHGWKWTNPTGLPERKQAQLRPGEPFERWEREDHWAYCVERGGQWTLTHRGIDGDIETGKKDLGIAIGEYHALHVAYCAMSDALYGVKLLGSEWTDAAPIVALAKVTEALADARATLAAERAPAPPPVRLVGVEYGTPDGALALGTIEVAPGPGIEGGAIEVRVELVRPDVVASAPLFAAAPLFTPPLPPTAPPLGPIVVQYVNAAGEPSAPSPGPTAASVAAQYGVDPASLPPAPPPPEAPWAIPVPPGQTTIPYGYARTIAALTLEAFDAPQALIWAVDLQTDLGAPPEGTPDDPNEFADGRWGNLLAKVQGLVASQANDPAAQTPLVVRVDGVRGRGPGSLIAVWLDLKPNRVNLARIANGPPPFGRWRFLPRHDALTDGPRVEANYFMDGVPF